jgi:hypothetical protein
MQCNPMNLYSCGVGGSRQRMFNLVNTYYKDLCTPKISIEPKDPSSPDPSGVAPGIPDVPVKDLPLRSYMELQKHEMCKVCSHHVCGMHFSITTCVLCTALQAIPCNMHPKDKQGVISYMRGGILLTTPCTVYEHLGPPACAAIIGVVAPGSAIT